MLDLNFKVLVTTETKYKRVYTTYSINDIVICETIVYSELFCKIGRNGVPTERVRSVYKKAKETSWDSLGIQKLTGILPDIYGKTRDFEDIYPDTTYGSTGKAVSKKEVVELMKAFIIKHS